MYMGFQLTQIFRLKGDFWKEKSFCLEKYLIFTGFCFALNLLAYKRVNKILFYLGYYCYYSEIAVKLNTKLHTLETKKQVPFKRLFSSQGLFLCGKVNLYLIQL